MTISKEEKDMTLETPWGGMFNYRVAFLLFNEGKVLLQKSSEGYWFPPGGRVKFGERSIDAVNREIKEELQTSDLELEHAGSIENFFSMDGKDFHEIMFVYRATTPKDLNIPTEDITGKPIVSEWFTAPETLESDIKPTFLKNRIFDFKEGFTHIIHRDN